VIRERYQSQQKNNDKMKHEFEQRDMEVRSIREKMDKMVMQMQKLQEHKEMVCAENSVLIEKIDRSHAEYVKLQAKMDQQQTEVERLQIDVEASCQAREQPKWASSHSFYLQKAQNIASKAKEDQKRAQEE